MVMKRWLFGLLGGIFFLSFVSAVSLDLSIDYPSNNSWYNFEIDHFNWTITSLGSDIDSFWYYINGPTQNFVTPYDNTTSISSNQGQNTIQAYVNNSLGWSISRSVSYFVDTTFPSMNISFPQNRTYDEEVLNISYDSDESNPNNCWYSTNGGVTNSTPGSCGGDFSSVDFLQGDNKWTVYINDSAGNQNSSSISFWVDSLSPSIVRNSPSTSPEYLAQDYFSINVTIEENNPERIQFNVDTGVSSITEERTYSNNNSEVFRFPSAGTTSDGNYTYTITANDSVGKGSVLIGEVILDSVSPSVSILNGDGANLTGNVYLNVSATDSSAGISLVKFLIDGTNVGNCTESCGYLWDSANVLDGSHNFSVIATDRAGNKHAVEISIETDNTNPEITFNSPLAGNYSSNQTVNITATDSHLTLIELYVNNVLISNSTESELTHVLSEGESSVYAKAYDSFGNENVTQTRTIRIDFTAPVLNLIGDNPQNIEISGTYSELGASATDDLEGSLTSSILIDSSEVNMSSIGMYNVSYYVSDSSGNNVTKYRTVNVVDSAEPIINLVSPSDNSPYNFGSSVSLEFNSTDSSTINNCSLYVNGVLNQTFSSVDQTRNYNSTLTLGSGLHSWKVQCSDASNNVANSQTREFTVLSSISFLDNTTEYTTLSNEADISNVSWFYVSSLYGEINWTSAIDFSSGIDWSACINISENRVEVNSSCFPGLNVSARITLHNLTYADPQALKDSSFCNECVEESYTGGTFIFNTSSFSVYSAQETPTSSSSSSGSSGGSGTKYYRCETWGEWSACSNELQTRTCEKKVTTSRLNRESLTQTRSCSLPEIPTPNLEEFEEEESEPEEIVQEGGILSRITGAFAGATIGANKKRAITMLAFILILAGIYFTIRYIESKKRR